MRVVKKPEERRMEMVEAASRLFAQQGFVRTSVAEIVTAVDVAKGLFYYYFTTKSDMVKAVVEGYCAYIGNIVRETAEKEGSADQKLRSLFSHEVWSSCFTQPLLHDLCLNENLALYADMCDRLVAHTAPYLTKIVAQGLREQGMEDTNAEKITEAMLYGILMMNRTGRFSADEFHQALERLSGLRIRIEEKTPEEKIA